MGWFLGLGSAGLVLLALSLVFDGILEGFFESIGGGFGGGLSGLDGALSLPVIAGFVSALGFSGAIATGAAGAGAVVATLTGIAAGAVVAWLTWRFSRALLRDGAAPRRGARTSQVRRVRWSRPFPPTATARSCCIWAGSR